MKKQQQLTQAQTEELLELLKRRFIKNIKRHPELSWTKLEERLRKSKKLWSLREMEETGGEPDVIDYDQKTGEYIFFDCSPESSKDRRSLCYDHEALESRKENRPKDNVIDMAAGMGIELLTEEQYRYLQTMGNFDTKTSSWIKTPDSIRELGGAIFADYRYGQVFVYHNGASSYYAARGFRGCLRV